MRALLVTSQVTFVPENYAPLVSGLALDPHIHGLLILSNLDRALIAQAAGLIVANIAPRLGASLLKNALGSLRDAREAAFRAAGKPVFRLAQINSPAALELVRSEGIDLILNARTRFIYKKDLLEAPRLGCLNIHHGLLPDQRGVFCDLWALSQSSTAGFSIHQMTEKLDDGCILEARTTSQRGEEHDFLAFTHRSAALECESVRKILNRVESEQNLKGDANSKSAATRYYKNPTPAQIREFRRSGGLIL